MYTSRKSHKSHQIFTVHITDEGKIMTRSLVEIHAFFFHNRWDKLSNLGYCQDIKYLGGSRPCPHHTIFLQRIIVYNLFEHISIRVCVCVRARVPATDINY